MGDPTQAIIGAVRARLIATPAVVSAVPARNILDWTEAPTRSPMIMIGEGQAIFRDKFRRFYTTAHTDLHVWCREDGTRVAKEVAGIVIDALEAPFTIPGLFVSDLRVSATRYLRDPGGKYSHGVINLQAIVQERS